MDRRIKVENIKISLLDYSSNQEGIFLEISISFFSLYFNYQTGKRIYREYLEGLSMDKITAMLECDGNLTGTGGKGGTQAPSTKFFETRNTSAMLCSRKPTPPTS